MCSDVQCALSNFKEAREEEKLVKYSTIPVQECTEVMLERDDHMEPLNPRPPCKRTVSEKKPKRLKKCNTEEDIEVDEQPLYVSIEDENIKCN